MGCFSGILSEHTADVFCIIFPQKKVHCLTSGRGVPFSGCSPTSLSACLTEARFARDFWMFSVGFFLLDFPKWVDCLRMGGWVARLWVSCYLGKIPPPPQQWSFASSGVHVKLASFRSLLLLVDWSRFSLFAAQKEGFEASILSVCGFWGIWR